MSTPLTGGAAGSPVGEAAGLADSVAAAVLAVDGVAALHATEAIATYLPGRRVAGVAVREDGSVEVAVAALSQGLSTDLHDLARRVQAAVVPLVGGPVAVTIADVVPAEHHPPPRSLA